MSFIYSVTNSVMDQGTSRPQQTHAESLGMEQYNEKQETEAQKSQETTRKWFGGCYFLSLFSKIYTALNDGLQRASLFTCTGISHQKDWITPLAIHLLKHLGNKTKPSCTKRWKWVYFCGCNFWAWHLLFDMSHRNIWKAHTVKLQLWENTQWRIISIQCNPSHIAAVHSSKYSWIFFLQVQSYICNFESCSSCS